MKRNATRSAATTNAKRRAAKSTLRKANRQPATKPVKRKNAMNGNDEPNAAGTATAAPAPAENRELLTFEDVAAMLQIHADTIQAMSRTGKMPRALKLGYRTIRFRRADITDWIRLGCKSLKAFEAARDVEREREQRERNMQAKSKQAAK